MDIGTFMTAVLTIVTLLGNVAFIALLLSRFVARGMFDMIIGVLGKHAMLYAFLISLGSLVGSLVYSEVVGYPACILCWIQRIFMYPLPFMFALALKRHETVVTPYAFVLAGVGALVALYQWVKDVLLLYGGVTIGCPAVAGLPSCDRIYVNEYGYVTIPMIALNAFIWIMVVLYASGKARTQVAS